MQNDLEPVFVLTDNSRIACISKDLLMAVQLKTGALLFQFSLRAGFFQTAKSALVLSICSVGNPQMLKWTVDGIFKNESEKHAILSVN